jgi:hypothetical protein
LSDIFISPGREAQGAFSRNEFASSPCEINRGNVKRMNQMRGVAQNIRYLFGGYFTGQVGICLKESRETNYFYRVIQALQIGEQKECNRLVKESEELQNIFGSIFSKVKPYMGSKKLKVKSSPREIMKLV